MQEKLIAQGKILVPDATDIEAAIAVSEWMEGTRMLRKSPEQVLAWFAEKRSILIAGVKDGLPVAHAAITYIYPPSESTNEVFGEIGGVVVDKNQYGHGYGTLAVGAIFQYAREVFGNINQFALCNETNEGKGLKGSLGIFLNSGATIMSEVDIKRLPSEVWGECIHCPSFQVAKAAGKFCCDTPVLIYNATKV